jgi:hypothetical protein
MAQLYGTTKITLCASANGKLLPETARKSLRLTRQIVTLVMFHDCIIGFLTESRARTDCFAFAGFESGRKCHWLVRLPGLPSWSPVGPRASPSQYETSPIRKTEQLNIGLDVVLKNLLSIDAPETLSGWRSVPLKPKTDLNGSPIRLSQRSELLGRHVLKF